jgi:hypothetical protein
MPLRQAGPVKNPVTRDKVALNVAVSSQRASTRRIGGNLMPCWVPVTGQPRRAGNLPFERKNFYEIILVTVNEYA